MPKELVCVVTSIILQNLIQRCNRNQRAVHRSGSIYSRVTLMPGCYVTEGQNAVSGGGLEASP